MTDTSATNPRQAMSAEELRRTMGVLEPMYDLVRVVDPSVTQGRTLTADGELDMPHRCFDLLCKGRRCQNCISARTIQTKQSVSKFEFVGEDAFYISTQYVEVDGEPRSIEMVRQIHDASLLGAGDSGRSDLRALATRDSLERYLDPMTGALNRAYLEEGVGGLRGSKVALMDVTGTDAEEALRAVAQAVLKGIRDVDTLVRYGETTFAVIFEGIPSHLVGQRLAQIREQALTRLVELDEAKGADILVGAVIGDDTLGALVGRAEEALGQAHTGTLPLVLLDLEGDKVAEGQAALGTVPAPGAHANSVDALTGLPMPPVFRKLLQERIDRITPADGRLLVIHLDIENFKAFNRAYGLPEGDVLLVEFAHALRNEFDRCLVTRSGTDMFDIATKDRDGMSRRLEHLKARLAGLRRDVALELKAGVFEVRGPDILAPNAMDLAKMACDSIKGKYDLSLRMFDTKLERAISIRTHITESLDEALEKGYIRPYYQAIVRPFTGRACAAEALSRWDDPETGLLSPADVIPTLEQHHLIHKHDVHMVRCVCRDLRAQLDSGRAVVPVSVNLSRLDFELCDIFAEVESCMEEFGIDRSLVGIEVTESTLDKADSVFRPQIERFRAAGYEIWMDDFGSGYSSLNLLKDYRFDVLKIDMAFLSGLEGNHNSKEIISSIVDMAKRIGIRTLAEGVETEAQFAFLRNIGCEMIQGYLFSRPAPLEELDFSSSIGVEDLGERAYFESVGRVNLLSQHPTDAVDPTKEGAVRAMPLAVVEWDGARLRLLTANESYLGLNDAMAGLGPELVQVLPVAGGGHTVAVSLADTGRRATVQFVASNGDASAYLVSPQQP